jgi:signal transduction histidine kinase
MLANISHDLGSPITGIHIYLQLMKEGKIQSGNANVIELLLEKATYIKRLNHDLFELSKLESKQLSLKFERVSLQAFIDEVYHSFEHDLRSEQMELQLGKAETMMWGREGFVNIDTIRIKQVLQNFIENAVKFSRSAGKPITLNCYVLEHHAFIEVMDYGPGISEEELPQVFNRFYKRQEGNTDGTGLGLTISKEIIEQHIGTIGVVSELGKGSTFFFSLPLR